MNVMSGMNLNMVRLKQDNLLCTENVLSTGVESIDYKTNENFSQRMVWCGECSFSKDYT